MGLAGYFDEAGCPGLTGNLYLTGYLGLIGSLGLAGYQHNRLSGVDLSEWFGYLHLDRLSCDWLNGFYLLI